MIEKRPIVTKKNIAKIVAENLVLKRKRLRKNGKYTTDELVVMMTRFFREMENNFLERNTVSIKNFGKFEMVKRKARIGRNPFSGASVNIPPRWRVRFKFSPRIIIRLNQL